MIIWNRSFAIGGLLGSFLLSLFIPHSHSFTGSLLVGISMGILICVLYYISVTGFYGYSPHPANKDDWHQLLYRHSKNMMYVIWGFLQVPPVVFTLLLGMAGANGGVFLGGVIISLVVAVLFLFFYEATGGFDPN